MSIVIRTGFGLLSVMGLTGLAQAQTARPASLDILFDTQQSALRQAIGSLGAALVTGAIDVGMPLRLAEVSSGRDYVLAVNNGDAGVFIIQNLTGPITARPVNVPSAPDRIFLSPSGASAALYYSAKGMFVVLGNLPANPQVTRTVTPAGARDSLVCAGISDDGEVLAAALHFRQAPRASGNGTHTSLYLDSSGVERLLNGASNISAISFLRGSHDSIVSDSGQNAVYRVRIGGNGPELDEIAGARDGVAGAVGVALSWNNSRAFAVNASGDILEIDPNGQGARIVATCSCKPSGLYKTAGNARFRLNSLPDRSLWIFDGDTRPARIMFIPVQDGTGGEN